MGSCQHSHIGAVVGWQRMQAEGIGPLGVSAGHLHAPWAHIKVLGCGLSYLGLCC